jgi:hypothetical protein
MYILEDMFSFLNNRVNGNLYVNLRCQQDYLS